MKNKTKLFSIDELLQKYAVRLYHICSYKICKFTFLTDQATFIQPRIFVYSYLPCQVLPIALRFSVSFLFYHFIITRISDLIIFIFSWFLAFVSGMLEQTLFVFYTLWFRIRFICNFLNLARSLLNDFLISHCVRSRNFKLHSKILTSCQVCVPY